MGATDVEPHMETASIVARMFNNTKLFVAGPAHAKAGLIAIPDIFGPDSGRIKEDAVALGKLGYAVVLVDAADGDYFETLDGEDVPAWLLKNSFEKVAGAHVGNAIAYLQSEVGVSSISSYGYCWGAYIGAKQSSLPIPVIKGHVSFHPSWMAEELINGDVQKMAEAISVPQLLCSAGNDPPVVREGGAMESILKAKPDVGECCRVVDFPGMVHGWVCRGDLADPATKEAVEKAWRVASEFIQAVNPL
ncbi:putative endo-1,3-1,4-beta glucanase [Phytophthora cinnamomi]|uniref:putative endo-1,3-1,4-beta glucanase n=1 Tax=Phytophthora cinnamomi TaxID=4785 RepID=UPI003559BA5D|nr:putative endo-1,3-1,4-beta glucanase [Phytophthora cinnamomi]